MAAAIALASCGPLPKPYVLEVPAPKTEEPKAPEPVTPEVAAPKPQSDIQMPPMLDLPGEGEFRASAPQPKTDGSGAVISRPPTDPPSRVKPKEGE